MERDIAKDRELCEKATPGPWFVNPRSAYIVSTHPKSHYYGSFVDGRVVHRVANTKFDTFGNSKADAQFIAVSRTALPYYISRTEHLERMVEELRARLAKSEAVCAEMREALESAEAWAKNDCDSCKSPFKEDDTCQFPNLCTTRPTLAIIQKALSSHAGKDLLERLRQAEELLAQVKPLLLDCLSCEGEICPYYKRCHTQEPYATVDAFLKGGGKDA